jgi:hypothetical protein
VGGAGEEGGFGGFSATLTGGRGHGAEGDDVGGFWEVGLPCWVGSRLWVH